MKATIATLGGILLALGLLGFNAVAVTWFTSRSDDNPPPQEKFGILSPVLIQPMAVSALILPGGLMVLWATTRAKK